MHLCCRMQSNPARVASVTTSLCDSAYQPAPRPDSQLNVLHYANGSPESRTPPSASSFLRRLTNLAWVSPRSHLPSETPACCYGRSEDPVLQQTHGDVVRLVMPSSEYVADCGAGKYMRLIANLVWYFCCIEAEGRHRQILNWVSLRAFVRCDLHGHPSLSLQDEGASR